MNHTKFTAALVLAIQLFSHICHGQKKDEVNFSDPFQLDSSDYFIIPRLIDDDNVAQYGKGKGYLPWNNYNDIIFYNSNTNQTKKLFGNQLALITSFTPPRNYYDRERPAEIPVNFLASHIIYLARTENFNGDNGLDSEDPVYLYISDKTGDKLTQVTPKAMNVLSWTLSNDKKFLLVKMQADKNGNKKFGNGDDQVYYRIDLDTDISKIRCYQIIL